MRFRAWAFIAFGLVGCGKTVPLDRLAQGSFVDPPQTVTVKILNYKPQLGGVLQNLFVTNYSVRPIQGRLYYSTARDGLTDALKTQLVGQYGFVVNQPESVVNGFADTLLFSLGIQSQSQSVIHCTQMQQTANDGFDYLDARLGTRQFIGLRDCEKTYLNLDPLKLDFAGNGIPDSLKLRCGLNPLNPSDAFISTAGDGVANIDKCKRNIPIDESAFSQPNQTYAYRYDTVANGDGTFELTVSNIPVLNNGDENFIAMQIVEQNLSSGVPTYFSAFTITRAAQVGGTLRITYWPTPDPLTQTNQQITIP